MIKKWFREEFVTGTIAAHQQFFRIFEKDENGNEKVICDILQSGEEEEFNSRLIENAPVMLKNIKRTYNFLNYKTELTLPEDNLKALSKELLEKIYDKKIEDILK